MEAILAATKYGGEIMGMGNELGMVKQGYLADLLLVDGDPVANVRILQDKTRLLAIMKDGEFHKAPRMNEQRRRLTRVSLIVGKSGAGADRAPGMGPASALLGGRRLVCGWLFGVWPEWLDAAARSRRRPSSARCSTA